MQTSAQVVIIGAGAIGCSTAYHLAKLGFNDIAVVEMGTVGSGTSSKSAAMLTMQFGSNELSARLAKYSYARYMRFQEEFGIPTDFRKTGWINYATSETAEALQKQAQMLLSLGIPTEVLSQGDLQRLYPELNQADFAYATYGPDDGPFDPHMIITGYTKRATELGVTFYEGVRATNIRLQKSRLVGIETNQGFLATELGINAAGPWAVEVCQWIGVSLPLRNSARCILVTGATPQIPPDRPFVEDLSAEWYFRPEGDGVLMGMGQIRTEDLSLQIHDQMKPTIIETAVHRVPVLTSAHVRTAWTGIRPLTPDNLPILGALPGIDGFLLNTGWGGMGIIQSPIAGQVLAEYVQDGQSSTFDILPFSISRFLR